jgi:hypothetical protein
MLSPIQLWSCHVWKDMGLFLRLLLFCILFVLLFLLLLCCFVFCFSFCAVFFLFLYKSTDHCHRVGTQLQYINIVSTSISHKWEGWRTGIPSHSGCYIRLLMFHYNSLLLLLLPHNTSTSLEMAKLCCGNTNLNTRAHNSWHVKTCFVSNTNMTRVLLIHRHRHRV